MKTVNHPKKFDSPPGITSSSIYIKGELKWRDKLLDSLRGRFGKLTAVVAKDDFDSDWDLKHLGQAEVAVINFGKNLDVHNVFLLPITFFEKFAPRLFILVDDKHKDKELIKKYAELCKVTIIDSVAAMDKILDATFSHLV